MVLASNIDVKVDENGKVETDRKVTVRVEQHKQNKDELGNIVSTERRPAFASLQDVLYSMLRENRKLEVRNLELQGRIRALEDRHTAQQNQIDNLYKWLCELDPNAKYAIERVERTRAELLNADVQRDTEARKDATPQTSTDVNGNDLTGRD